MPGHRRGDLEFSPALQLFNSSIAAMPLVVLSGGNNSGKSITLRSMKQALGRTAYFVGTNRFYHVYHLATGMRDPNELEQFENQFASHFFDENHNHEANVLDLNRIMMGLSDARRDHLFRLCGSLIGNTFSLKKVQDDNELSPRYIDMDGQNLAVGSTGTRLLMTLLGLCMDDRFTTILIDEPELGLSPRIQAALSAFFQDSQRRTEHFPHLARIVLSTHSHLFLNRRDIKSNYIVSKENARISLARVKTHEELHRLQFNLLGNDLESMFFPSAIIIVEGKTDFAYIDRLIQISHPDRKITVLSASGDIKKKLHTVREAFGDLKKSPFSSRIFAVLDSVYSHRGLPDELEQMGVKKDHIIVWEKNGIEHYYPRELVASAFCCSVEDADNLKISGDQILINGITKTKNELAVEVVRALQKAHQLSSELESKLLTPLRQAID